MTTSLLTTLTAVRDEHGLLTPELVVDVARDPTHPLHSRFEWDDSIAGERYRVDQAGQLLRVVKLPGLPGQRDDLRAFLAVRGTDSRKADYVPTAEAMADPFSSKLLLAEMEREWKALKRRWQHLGQFAEMVGQDVAGAA